MALSKAKSGAAIAAAAAGLLLSGCATSGDANMAKNEAKVHCAGVNSCKGQTACKSAKNDCKGKNSCKGQGWLSKTQAQCESEGGSII